MTDQWSGRRVHVVTINIPTSTTYHDSELQNIKKNPFGGLTDPYMWNIHSLQHIDNILKKMKDERCNLSKNREERKHKSFMS